MCVFQIHRKPKAPIFKMFGWLNVRLLRFVSIHCIQSITVESGVLILHWETTSQLYQSSVVTSSSGLNLVIGVVLRMDLLVNMAAVTKTACSMNSAMVSKLAPRHSPSIPPIFAKTPKIKYNNRCLRKTYYM